MKRIILPIIAAVVMSLTATSCTREEFESTNTVWCQFTVTNDMWERDAQTEDLVCSLNWDVLTDAVLATGNIQAYLYEGQRQVPLPYVYPTTFSNADGETVYLPLNIRFDVERGTISFIVTDCGEFLTEPINLLTMNFRAVVTYPVIYRR